MFFKRVNPFTNHCTSLRQRCSGVVGIFQDAGTVQKADCIQNHSLYVHIMSRLQKKGVTLDAKSSLKHQDYFRDVSSIPCWPNTSQDVSRRNIVHLSHHQLSLNREGCWGTTNDFETNFLHFFLFYTALWDLANSRPVHSLMLSSHLFLCLPSLILPFTVPCKMVLTRPDELETVPYHCSLRLFTMVRRSLCCLIACWLLARTSSLVTWSLYEMCSIRAARGLLSNLQVVPSELILPGHPAASFGKPSS